MPMRLRTVVPVWVAALVSAVLIAVLVPAADYLAWLPLAMAFLVFLTFILQLIIVQKEGLVDRMAASLGGGILILGLATLVLSLIAAAQG